MKCQAYMGNHFAAQCRQIHDTCAQCGQMHRTVDCNAGPNVKYCANCKTHGHAASDRKCPIFIRECERLLNAHPENRYRFFPMANDPTTWESSQPQATPPGVVELPATGEPPRPTEAEARRTQNAPPPHGWTGGSRGAAPRGTSQTTGRRPFQPPRSDTGWENRGFETAGDLLRKQRAELAAQENVAGPSRPQPQAQPLQQTQP
jgi:hypothetical protein